MRKFDGYATAALIAAGTLAGVATVARSSDHARPAHPPGMSEVRRRDLNIGFYQKRTRFDSLSARDFAQLAGLYLQRARESADNADLLRAEAAARHSLHLRTDRNGAAFGVLASSLLAQHRFAEALETASRLVAYDSTSLSSRGLLAETELELGRYDEAGRAFGTLRTYGGDLSVAPRLARWEELRGRPEEARRLLRDARDEAESRHAMPREQLAWFHLRVGDLALRNGHLGEAELELRAGLGVSPDDYRLLGTMARLEAVRHRWDLAAEYGEQAIARALDPGTLGVLCDAYTALGDTARAADSFRAMEVAVLHQPGPFHRAWSLFLLDHDRAVDTVLAKARDELAVRRDIYGYDLLAWALHKAGRSSEARAPMARALALGTRDAMLLYHAAMIDRAVGDEASARTRLEAALAVNPYWHPTQPAAARALLDSLRAR